MQNLNKYINEARGRVTILGTTEDNTHVLLSEARKAGELDFERACNIIKILLAQCVRLSENDLIYGEVCQCCGIESAMTVKQVELYLSATRDNNYRVIADKVKRK